MDERITDRLIIGDRHVPRAELFERASRLATSLHGLGIGENDRVAILMRNDLPFVEVALAVNLLGAFSVPLNWHMTTVELEAVLDDCEARLVFCHNDLYSALEPSADGRHVVRVQPSEPVRQAYGISYKSADARDGYEDLFASEPWMGRPPAFRSNIIYTSGTTGQPKGVVREPATGEMIERVQEAVELAYGLGRNECIRTVVTGPMYHSVPNVYALTAIRRPESLVVLQPRFDPEELLRLIEQYRISHLHLVPTMFVRLLKLPAAVRSRYDLSSLKFVVHGAAPCPPDIKQRMIRWWGPVIHEYYGASETGPAVAHGSEEALRKPGTVGKPLPGAEVKILGSAGQWLGPMEVGEVYVRIHGYPQSTYLNKGELFTRSKKDGYTSAGDLGYLDGDGYLFLTGRASDMIVSGGVNIYPQEIEVAIQQIEGVRDAAVFGIPDPEFGESVCACIQPDSGVTLDADEIRAGLQGRLSRYKIPRLIRFSAYFPREDSGKLKKRLLREELLNDLRSQA